MGNRYAPFGRDKRKGEGNLPPAFNLGLFIELWTFSSYKYLLLTW